MKNLNIIGIMVLAMMMVVPAAFAMPALNVESSCKGGPLNIITIMGSVQDTHGNFLDNVPVDVYCQHDAMSPIYQIPATGGVVTDHGWYSTWAWNYPTTVCAVGDKAWINVAYNGSVYTSAPVTVSCETSGSLYIDSARVDNEVPEFGVIAATVAMIGAVGGIIVMRKH